MSKNGRLAGKVAVITGAGSGIGRASALLFAEEGAKVVAVDINANSATETAKMIKDKGGQATAVQADVSRSVDAEKMIKAAVSTYGKLDILFNNAGIAGDTGVGLENSTEEQWDKVMDVNLKGVFLGCKYAIPEMKKNGSGSIVNTASTGAFLASERTLAYGVSKAGVVLYSRGLAVAVGK